MPAPTFAAHTLLAVKNFTAKKRGGDIGKIHFGKLEKI